MKDVMYNGTSWVASEVATQSLLDFLEKEMKRHYLEVSEEVRMDMLTVVHGLCSQATPPAFAPAFEEKVITPEKTTEDDDNSGDGQALETGKPNGNRKKNNGGNS